MPQLTINLTDERLRDIQAAAEMIGETCDAFLLHTALDEAHGLLLDPWRIYEQFLEGRFVSLLGRLR